MLFRLRAAAPIIALVLVLVAACSGDGSGLPTLEIDSAGGARASLRIEVAESRDERARGLSGRDFLPRDQGMLFVLEGRSSGFWMRDVSFPLSIAFIDSCGLILGIQDMAPNTPELHTIEQDYRYALEVNGGWFGRNGVGEGDRVLLPEHLLMRTC